MNKSYHRDNRLRGYDIITNSYIIMILYYYSRANTLEVLWLLLVMASKLFALI